MKKKLELCGYFDNNFGDDYMLKITAHYMSEYKLYVSEKEAVSEVLLREENVECESEEKLKPLLKLMVIGSGFMINSFEAFKCELKWFLQKKRFADFCIGCSIEPFNNHFSEWLIAQKLNRFKYITCRDKKSYLWFRANCPRMKVEYMPDLLFAMPDEWLLKQNGGEKLGISLLRAGGTYYGKMAEIADYWIENHKKGVILMAFDSGLEDDVSACENVKALIKHKDKAEIIVHRRGGEIIDAYSDCKKVIGARFHSAVLAMKMGVDFYPIIYRDKMRNLIADVEYPIKGSKISDIDIKDITCFLGERNIGFKVCDTFCRKAESSFKLLKKHIEELV